MLALERCGEFIATPPGIYGGNIFMILGSYILGIGHIAGIDAMRWKLRSFATGTSARRVQSDY